MAVSNDACAHFDSSFWGCIGVGGRQQVAIFNGEAANSLECCNTAPPSLAWPTSHVHLVRTMHWYTTPASTSWSIRTAKSAVTSVIRQQRRWRNIFGCLMLDGGGCRGGGEGLSQRREILAYSKTRGFNRQIRRISSCIPLLIFIKTFAVKLSQLGLKRKRAVCAET